MQEGSRNLECQKYSVVKPEPGEFSWWQNDASSHKSPGGRRLDRLCMPELLMCQQKHSGQIQTNLRLTNHTVCLRRSYDAATAGDACIPLQGFWDESFYFLWHSAAGAPGGAPECWWGHDLVLAAVDVWEVNPQMQDLSPGLSDVMPSKQIISLKPLNCVKKDE